MLFSRHYFTSFIALIALLSELLVIFLGGVPYAPGQFYVELQISSYVSIALLGLMVLGVIALMVWKRRMPDLPRAPDTVAAVMTYIADSRMLEDFEGLEFCDDIELRDKLAVRGKKYMYGKKPGSDGNTRFMVDEESPSMYL